MTELLKLILPVHKHAEWQGPTGGSVQGGGVALSARAREKFVDHWGRHCATPRKKNF